MTVDAMISRVAAALSIVAILGIGVHLISGPPHPEPQTAAYPTVPDTAFIETGEGIDVHTAAPPALMADSTAVSPADIPVPAVEPLVLDEQPLQAGEGLDSVLASLSGQINNSIGPTFMNLGINTPLSLGQKFLQDIPSMLDTTAVAALPAESLPMDAVPAF